MRQLPGSSDIGHYCGDGGTCTVTVGACMWGGRHMSAAAMNAGGAHCNDGLATLGMGSDVMGKSDVGVYGWCC